jgi:lysophospholipase L1-like esterase
MWFLLPAFAGSLLALYGIRSFITGSRCRGGCRIAVVGDSIASGQFPDILGASVPGASVQSFGMVGRGTASMEIPTGYDEIIIQGGLNDIGRPEAKDYILNNLDSLVQRAKRTGARVILLSLTPWSRAPGLIEDINYSLRWRSPFWGVDRFIDIWTPLADNSGGLKADLIGDQMGVHPNSIGHRIIADKIIRKAY